MPTPRHNGFTINNLPVFGFGMERAVSEDPWFTGRDYNRVIAAVDPRRIVIPQTFAKIAAHFEQLGFMETERLRPADSRGPKRAMAVTYEARGPFVDTLVHHTTHGHTLAELLILPGSVDFVLEETHYRERLVQAASGLAVASQRLKAS